MTCLLANKWLLYCCICLGYFCKSCADTNHLETNLPAKKTCVTSDFDDVAAMDVENTSSASDDEVDAEDVLESVYGLINFFSNLF